MEGKDIGAFGDEEPIGVGSADHIEDDRSQPRTGDGASPGKIFIGGLARETTSAQFVKYFGKYGEITDSVIMKDRKTGNPRGFGFVTYADPYVVDRVIQETHIINGKQVEIKRTIPRGAATGSRDFRTRKIFVGGIPATVSEDEFRDFFAQFGEVIEHQIMMDHETNRSRGFGFVTFDTDQAVEDLLEKGNRLELNGALVEIKKAEPKKPTHPPSSSKRYNDSRASFGGGFGDAYSGLGGGSGFSDGYRSGGGVYGSRMGAYGGYSGGELGGYGGYGGSGMGAYRGDPSLGYSGRYGGVLTRGYDFGGGYGGPGEYGGYGAGPGPGPGPGPSYGGGYGSGYDTGLGGGYGSGSGGSFYGSRGGYGGAGSSNRRYHPYGR